MLGPLTEGGGAAAWRGGPTEPPTFTVITFVAGAGGGAGGVEGAGDAPFVATPAAQIAPSGATATAVTSRFDIWYRTNPSPAGETRNTRPPGSVPTIRSPFPSSAIERTCVSSVRKKTLPFPSGV